MLDGSRQLYCMLFLLGIYFKKIVRFFFSFRVLLIDHGMCIQRNLSIVFAMNVTDVIQQYDHWQIIYLFYSYVLYHSMHIPLSRIMCSFFVLVNKLFFLFRLSVHYYHTFHFLPCRLI